MADPKPTVKKLDSPTDDKSKTPDLSEAPTPAVAPETKAESNVDAPVAEPKSVDYGENEHKPEVLYARDKK